MKAADELDAAPDEDSSDQEGVEQAESDSEDANVDTPVGTFQSSAEPVFGLIQIAANWTMSFSQLSLQICCTPVAHLLQLVPQQCLTGHQLGEQPCSCTV